MYLPEITLAVFSVFNLLRLGSYVPADHPSGQRH